MQDEQPVTTMRTVTNGHPGHNVTDPVCRLSPRRMGEESREAVHPQSCLGDGAVCDLHEVGWGAKCRRGSGEGCSLTSSSRKGWGLVPWMEPWVSHPLEGADDARKSQRGLWESLDGEDSASSCSNPCLGLSHLGLEMVLQPSHCRCLLKGENNWG